jgi:hypothetical protein
MARQGIRDLVGRLMVDKEFLAALVRDPAPVLADYELAAEERAVLMVAATRARRVPEPERARSFQTSVIRRWAT